ncbi:F-box/LRR-repeat protein [Dirofilaria immitis]
MLRMDSITESPGRYWPVSRKYDTVDGRYKFFTASHASRMQVYYPLIRIGRTAYSSSRHNATTLKSQIPLRTEMEIDEFMADSSVEKGISTTINDLSNEILLKIFEYCHPIDLIHCFSLVSRRWNYLATYPNFFTEVRVLVNDFSLKYGSVKTFFQRTSQYLRKLCIDCSVPLPSTQVNELFDICFPNIIHLDISSFIAINVVLLKKISNCFPNVETLHMDGIKKEWKEVLDVLFGDETIFPQMKNFFMNVRQYSSLFDEKLSICKRPLSLLCIYNEGTNVNFSEIKTSPLRSTLTELYLEYCVGSDDYRYIADLHNLKAFSFFICVSTFDEDVAPLKSLYNLEKLRMGCGGENGCLTIEGMINLFTLPFKEPEKTFPFKLKHLEISEFYACKTDLLKAIDKNCPELKTLGLPFNEYMDDEAVPFIVSNFKHLVLLDLSNLRDCYKDEVWNNLSEDDLPDLRLLKLHGNKVNIENLQLLNLKRPKLLVSTRWNHFINWTKTKNGCVFHDTFDGDIRAVENDLRQIDGFRDFTITSPLFIYDDECLHPFVGRTLSYDSYPFLSGEKQRYRARSGNYSD